MDFGLPVSGKFGSRNRTETTTTETTDINLDYEGASGVIRTTLTFLQNIE